MPELERMTADDFNEVRDPHQLEQLIALEEREAAAHPGATGYKETLEAMRLRLAQLRRDQQN